MASIKMFLCLEISVSFLSSVNLSNDTGVCPNGTQVSCCNNYYKVNNKCIECQPGTFGENCSENCPNGSYGPLCVFKCNCISNEICDSKIGCKGELLTSEFETQTVTDFPESPGNAPNLPFLSSVFYLSLAISLSAIVICILIGTTIYFARRLKEGGWSVYACPLPVNTVAVQEPQQEDYTVMLTNRTQHRKWENKERYQKAIK